MKQNLPRVIFRRWLEKSPVCQPIEIVRRFCSTAKFWETGHPDKHLAREPSKAFHNPAPAAAAIPNWPANRGLCSNRAVEASWQKLPVTNPSLCAISSPAGQSNSLGCPSRPTTVTRAHRKVVFTQTQTTQQCHNFALADGGLFS